MKKIPLEATVVGAYKFFFQNIISIIGTVWFPLVVFLAVVGGFVWGLIPHNWLTGHFEPPQDVGAFVRERIGLLVLVVPCLMITALLVGAMIRVGILHLALEEKPGLTLFWFSLGGRVWRMVGAVFVVVLIWIPIEIAAILLFVVLNAAMAAIPHVPALVVGLVNAVAVIAIVVSVIYVFVRLFFFLPAIIVAENRIGLSRSWELGKGNVWRAIVVWLAVTIPVHIIATIAIYATVIPTVLVKAIAITPSNDPTAAFAFLQSLWPLLPVIIGIGLVAGLIIAGTMLGAIAKAYKAVIAEETA